MFDKKSGGWNVELPDGSKVMLEEKDLPQIVALAVAKGLDLSKSLKENAEILQAAYLEYAMSKKK
jgi:hypothetical protein